jgi:hypothetical protein
VPPRVKFLVWLLTKNRIQCRTALVTKNILQGATFAICGGADESADHIFSGCNFVTAFWSAISWDPQRICSGNGAVDDTHTAKNPQGHSRSLSYVAGRYGNTAMRLYSEGLNPASLVSSRRAGSLFAPGLAEYQDKMHLWLPNGGTPFDM